MLEKWNNLRLLTKLMIMITATIAITVGSLYLMSRQLHKEAIIDTESNYLLNIGGDIADEVLIKEALAENQSSEPLTDFTQDYADKLDLDYVVVINTESIRLTHPDPNLIYEKFAGGDELEAFQGESYVSSGAGTLGISLRSFVPVYQNNEVIGAVVVGKTNHSIDAFSKKYDGQITFSLLISLAIGVTMAIFVSYTIKKELFNMEPNEIAKAFEERTAMLDYSHDSIIVTNDLGEITLANNEAIRHFHIQDFEKNPMIDTVIPMPEINDHNNGVFHIKDREYLLSQADILVNGQLLGQIYIIRDTSEIYALLDQLHSTAEFAQLLQGQAHEFLNRLHVIYGLTNLQEYEALTTYLESLIKEEEDLTIRLSMLVKNPVIAGYLIGETRSLKQSLENVIVNINSEIPNMTDDEINRCWIDTIQQLNNGLRDHFLGTQLKIELYIADNQLVTRYQMHGKMDDLADWLGHQDWDENHTIDANDQGLAFTFMIDYVQGELT